MNNYSFSIQDSIIYQTDSVAFQLQQIGKHIHALESKDTNFIGLGISNDTVFTVSTTLGIFILGHFLDRFTTFLNRKKQGEEKIKTFKGLIEQLLPFIDSRIEQFRSLEEETSLDFGLPQIPPRTTSDRFNRIYKMESEIMLHSSKVYNRIIQPLKNVDFVKLLSNSSDEYYNTFREEDDKARVEFTQLTESYNDLLANYLDKYKQGYNDIEGAPELRQLINLSIVNFYEHVAGGGSLQYFYDEIIRPIQEHIVDFNLYRTPRIEEIVFPIADTGKVLSHRFNTLSQRNEQFKNQYKQLADALENAKTEVTEDIGKL